MTDYTHRMPEDEEREEYALTFGNLPKILCESWRDYAGNSGGNIGVFIRIPLILGMILIGSGASRFSGYVAPYSMFLCVAVLLSFLAFLVLRYCIRIDEWGFILRLVLSLFYGFFMFALTYLFYGFIAVPSILFIPAMAGIALAVLFNAG